MRTNAFGLKQFWLDCGDHFFSDLFLQIENIAERTVEAIRPDMNPAGCVDELTGDTHSIRSLAYTPLEYVTHPKLATYLSRVRRSTLVGKTGIAGDHEQPTDS